MDNTQKINAWFDRFDDRFRQIVPEVVAESASEYFRDRFATQDWDQVPWQPLSPSYASRKTRGRGRILTATGLLQNSIRPTAITTRRVVISAGTNQTPYARAHNEGLRITGIQSVKAYTNTNFMGKGKKVEIPAHQRRVDYQLPKRQFIGTSRFLNQQIKSRLIAAFNASR